MLKKNYIYIALSILFLVLFGFFICNSFAFSSVPVLSENGAENGELVSINLNAKRAFVSGNEIAFFKFNNVHKILLKNTFSENGNVSVTLRLSARIPSSLLKDLKNGTIEEGEEVLTLLGFLDKDDFDKNGKLVFSMNNHPLVSANYLTLSGMGQDFMKGLSGFTYDVSFALPVDKAVGLLNQKEGIFVKSNVPVKIKSVKISRTITGFDRSEVIPFYGFSSNGGVLDFTSQSFDFTGSYNVFPMNYTGTTVPPVYTIKMDQDLEAYGEKLNYSFSFGGERIRIKRLETTTLSSLALKNAFSFVEPVNENKTYTGCVKAVLMSGGDKSLLNTGSYSINPVSVDPGLITSWPQKNWRCPEYELFKWDRFPNIIFFDTKNYAVQSKFFARIAFYIEKEGYKGRILSNEELKGKHDYNAHDYSAESLASFFNKTYISNFRLNDEEEILLEILLKNGILEKTDDQVKPYISKGGAVLSISREIPSYNRVSLLAHEGWHTLFFTDSDFRNYVAVVFNVMDHNSMKFLMDYFKSQASLGYDTNDEYLMQNEFMAYILQNTPGHAGEYFVKRATWESVRKFTPELCSYILSTEGSGFDDCSKMLGEFVSDKYNLIPGNIGLVSY